MKTNNTLRGNDFLPVHGRRLRPYREVDSDGLVLPVDFVGEVVEEAHDGGLLQRHGRAEAGAHDGGPRQGDAFPVVQVGQTHAAVVTQKAV